MSDPSTRKKWLKRIALIILLGAFVAAGVWGYRVAMSFAGEKGSIAEVWQGISDPRSLFPGQDHIVILIIGKDYNHDRRGIRYSKEARADTIMLLSADLVGKRLASVSVPRDTKVIGPSGSPQKINAMFQIGGAELLRTTLFAEFGVRTDYTVVLKDDAVKNIVDAVGGVEVEPIDDMFYEDSWGGLYIDLKKGRQRIDGKQAIGYVRFRKMGSHRIEDGRKVPVRRQSSLEEGDIRRTERQQLLLRALSAEAMSPRNLLRASSIVETGFGQIETTLSRPQVLALATIFKGQSLGNSVAVIPGTDNEEGGIYYWLPDRERAKLTIDWIIYGDEAAGRKLVRVAVYNGSGVNGLARRAAGLISGEGFSAFNAGSSKERPDHTEVVYRKAAHEDYARHIAAQIGAVDVKKDPGDPRADWRPEIRITLAKETADKLPPEPEPATARS